MSSKKERNHYDLKEIDYCRTIFPKRLAGKGKKQSDFTLRMDSYITRRAELSSQIRIAKSTSFMISTKGQAILVTQKQCQLILGEPQHTKKILLVSFHIKFTTMLRTTYKNVIVVKDKIVCHLT